MTDERHERLEAAEAGLRDLGLHLAVPEPPDVTAAVRARISASASPRRGRALLPRIAVATVVFLAAFGVAAAASPQVRAAVGSVLRFAGVEVRSGPGPAPRVVPTSAGSPLTPSRSASPSPSPTLPGEHPVDLATARSLASFPISIPALLGAPNEVTVSDGTPPRVVSLFYSGIRIDEFDGGLSPYFRKVANAASPETVTIPTTPGTSTPGATTEGLWIAGPQDVVYVDRTGQDVTSTAHQADATLIWQIGGVTMRMEGTHGTLDKDRAIAIAASAG